MKVLGLVVANLLLFALSPSALFNPDRAWQTAQVQQIQRAPNTVPCAPSLPRYRNAIDYHGHDSIGLSAPAPR